MQISFAITAKLISTFVFATRKVQFLFFLYWKFQASSCLLWLYSPVCVGPVQNPHCWFSHDAAHLFVDMIDDSVSFLFPACHNDVVKVVELACKHDVVVIPFGGKCLFILIDLLPMPMVCS